MDDVGLLEEEEEEAGGARKGNDHPHLHETSREASQAREEVSRPPPYLLQPWATCKEAFELALGSLHRDMKRIKNDKTT